jgi:hypothetical protein
MSESVPGRRWFRFHLRTLFVMVTVFGCWLAYEVNWIKERHAFLSRHQVLFQTMRQWEWAKRAVLKNTKQPANAPWGLRFFGEAGQPTLALIVPINRRRSELSADESNAMWAQEDKEARRLFPEAQVTVSINWCPDDEPNAVDR